MRIGELAKRAGVNIQTVRFYERRRPLPEPARTASGYRNYDSKDLGSVVFIKWCQQLGFTLKEVRPLLQLHTAVASLPSAHLDHKRQELQSIVRMAQAKLGNIEEKIKLMKVVGKQLKSAIRKLQCQPEPVCPASKPRAGPLRPSRARAARLRA